MKFHCHKELNVIVAGVISLIFATRRTRCVKVKTANANLASTKSTKTASSQSVHHVTEIVLNVLIKLISVLNAKIFYTQ